jgi:hypothetical protein
MAPGEAKAPGDVCAEFTPTVLRWSRAKELCLPTQKALGWDWALNKLAEHFSTEAAARACMARKPVPFVRYRGRCYVVDHHHTLVGH